MRKFFIWFAFVLSSFFFASCALDESDIETRESSSFILYSTTWGWEYDHVSALREGSSNRVQAWDGPSCQNGKKQENVVLCIDRIVHVPTGRVLELPNSLKNAKSASAGQTDRIVYLLDRQGDLHVLDTRWDTAADDAARLLLWSDGLERVDILAGNARRHLAGVELQGQMRAWTMHGDHLYVLYRAVRGAKWVWGVEKIDMTDFSVNPVGEETEVEDPSEVPDVLQVTGDGRLRVLQGSCLLAEIREP